MYGLAMPFAPYRQAAALWDKSTVMLPCDDTGRAVDVVVAAEDVSVRRVARNLGGLNADPDGDNASVCFDPRKVRLAAPPMPDLPDCGKPRTQYAPIGPVVMEPLPLAPGAACVCASTGVPWCGPASSVGALLLTPRNGVRVQRALQAAGIVTVSPLLQRYDETRLPLCVCEPLGGDPTLVGALVAFAKQYSDTPFVTQPSPQALVQYLDSVFVEQQLTNIRTAVSNAAVANYARAEGNRAYLVPRPWVDFATAGDTVAMNAAFSERALTDPASNPDRRAQLSCLSGTALCSSAVLPPA